MELSMLETAELWMKSKTKPQKFTKLSAEVFETMAISDDIHAKKAQLYTDLSLSGKFVALGDDLWDLKSRQAFEVADYDTYDLDFETEEPVALLGEDVPGIAELVTDAPVDLDDDEEENAPSDDYGDESSPEKKEGESDLHEGLSIYKEEDLN